MSKPARCTHDGLALTGACFALAMVAAIPDGRADNPIVQTIYTADPAPLVYNGFGAGRSQSPVTLSEGDASCKSSQ
jgi:hypothetical protein